MVAGITPAAAVPLTVKTISLLWTHITPLGREDMRLEGVLNTAPTLVAAATRWDVGLDRFLRWLTRFLCPVVFFEGTTFLRGVWAIMVVENEDINFQE